MVKSSFYNIYEEIKYIKKTTDLNWQDDTFNWKCNMSFMDWTSFYVVILQSITAEKIKYARFWNWREEVRYKSLVRGSELYITTYNNKEESDF